MPDKLSEKYNDSCVVLFDFLKLLVSGEGSYEKVIKLFAESSDNEKSNPHVVLNKYMNALKIFGLKVKKDNGYYHLLSFPYQIDLDENDLEALSLLKSMCKSLPPGKNKTSFEKFLEDLELRYNEKTQKLVDSFTTSSKTALYSMELSEQIRQCEQYCQDKFKLNITYLNKKNIEEQILQCSPVEVKYHKRKICLCVCTRDSSRIMEIPFECIKSVEQLPNMTQSSHPQAMTIVFKLKGKLVRNYRLRDWETSQGVDQDGNLIVVNKNEDFDILVSRLMRYGGLCEVMSPKIVRAMMIEAIEEAIKNYNNN